MLSGLFTLDPIFRNGPTSKLVVDGPLMNDRTKSGPFGDPQYKP